MASEERGGEGGCDGGDEGEGRGKEVGEDEEGVGVRERD